MADQKMENWENFLADCDSESPEDDLAAKITVTATATKELATSAVYFLQQSNVELDQLQATKNSIEARRRELTGKQKLTRAALYLALAQLGEKEYDTIHGRILKLAPVPFVVVDDIDLIPSWLKRPKYEAVKSDIKKEFEANRKVDGAHLEYTRSVVIK